MPDSRLDPTKVYLGCDVYVQIVHGMVRLSTEDGFRETNAIYLEPHILLVFQEWLRTADTWAVQRVKILQIVAALGLGEVKAHVSPAAQVLIATVVLVVNQISSAVGGPTI